MLIKKVEEAEVISLKHGIQMIKLHFSVLFLTLSNHGPSFPNAIHTVPLSGINHSLFNILGNSACLVHFYLKGSQLRLSRKKGMCDIDFHIS